MSGNNRRTGEHHFVFDLGGALYGISALAVREVALPHDLVGVPITTDAVAGICHFRNELLPVLNLQTLTDSFATRQSTGRQLLVISGTSGDWAIRIDRAIGLDSLDIASTTDVQWNDSWSNVLIGTASHAEGVVRVLDVDAVYRHASEQLQHLWAKTTGTVEHSELDLEGVASHSSNGGIGTCS